VKSSSNMVAELISIPKKDVVRSLALPSRACEPGIHMRLMVPRHDVAPQMQRLSSECKVDS
jgi:hypothetical protein